MGNPERGEEEPKGNSKRPAETFTLFMCPLSEKHWTRMVHQKGHDEGTLDTPAVQKKKKTLQHVSILPKTTWMVHKTCVKMFCGQMRQKLNILANVQCCIWRNKDTKQQNLRTWTPWNHWVNNEFKNVSRHFHRKISGQQHMTSSWKEFGWCKKTMTWILVSQLKNCWKRWKFMFCCGQVRVLTLTQLRCCGMTWRGMFNQDSPKILMNW